MTPETEIPPLLGSGQLYLSPEGEALIAKMNDVQRDILEQQEDEIAATFGTPAGQRTFAWMWQRVIVDGVGFDAGLGMDLGTASGFAREGQRLLVRQLLAMMERSRNRAEG